MKIHRRGSPNPAPFSFTPTGQWEGNDGNWSTFGIRVGTPAQSFRVQISTASGETWVPSIDSPGACTPSDPANCTTLRGILNNQTAGFSTSDVCTPSISTLPLLNFIYSLLHGYWEIYTVSNLKTVSITPEMAIMASTQ